MKKVLLTRTLVAFGIILLSITVFALLQHQQIYEATLGKISNNYERTGKNNNFQLIEVKKAYVKITPKNSYKWDAKLYKSIRDSSYSRTEFYNKERLAFYPLFPLVWKLTTIDSSFIFIFNYLLFVVSLLLLLHFFNSTSDNKPFIFLLALLLPSSMIYYLPYAESLFVLTLVIALVGLFQKRYWLYFLGAFAFSMTRPAAQIFIVALIATDLRYLITHKNIKYFIKEFLLKITPFILGIVAVTCIQYYYSGSWTAYYDSMIIWPAESGLFNQVVDWSIEGFGMTVFAIFFLALPCLVYALKWGIDAFKNKTAPPPSLFSGNSEWIKTYSFHASVLFIAGNLVYTFLTSGNSLNGFYRYSICVPCFYIVLFQLEEKINAISLKYKLAAFVACMLFMVLFLSHIIYGGNRFRFQYVGMYLFILLLLLLIVSPYLSYRKKLILTVLLILPCILWHTYLFNMYLCDAWLFT